MPLLSEKLELVRAATLAAREAAIAASIVCRLVYLANCEAAAEPTNEVLQTKAALAMFNFRDARLRVAKKDREALSAILEAALEAKPLPEGTPGRKIILGLAADVVARNSF